MKEYEPPEVVELGDLSDVTQSGTGSLSEDDWWNAEGAWWSDDEDGSR
jgi:hypothetical protein